MKKIFIAFLLCLLFSPLITKAQLEPFDFQLELVYENEYAAMYLDERNNNISIYQKATGEYFDTLVFNGEQGSVFTRNIQRSDFVLDVIRNLRDGTIQSFDSHTNAITRDEQVEHILIPQGVRTNFTLGDPNALNLDMFPYSLSHERMQEFVLDFMTEQEKTDFVGRFYHRMPDRYIRQWTPGQQVSTPNLRALNNAFYIQGSYTFEELALDNIEWEQEEFFPEILISLAVEYTLDGPDLIITVPRDSMGFTETQPFAGITMNPYFMSGSIYDEGFLFIPDGSGAIINFNNGKTSEDVSIPVFGRDPLKNSWFYLEPFDQATLPVYGIVRNNTAILAIIEEGAPVATIRANVSNRIDEFNRVYASFELMYQEGMLLMGSGVSTRNTVFDDIYDMDLRQRFVFLHDEDATHLGLARAYQNYLLSQGLLNSVPMPNDAPFFVDFIASAPRQRITLGIPNTHHFAMTTAEQAGNILRSLTNLGINNIHAQFSHWSNDGMLATPLNRIRPLRSIGGTRGMRNLQNTANELGVELYPQVRALTTITNGNIFTGQINRANFSRNISNQFAYTGWRQMVDRMWSGGVRMLSPLYWVDYSNNILRGFSNIGFNNISISDLGGMLYGDYAQRRQITRLDALYYADNMLDNFSNNLDIMLTNPNVNGFRVASSIVDIPFGRGQRRIIDINIPFVQMVLENHIPSSLPAFNIDPFAWRGFDEYLLRAVESRSGLKLNITHQNEIEFLPAYEQFWILNHMFFQTEFASWENRIGEYYARLNDFYKKVAGAHMTSHTALNNGEHVIVEYSNGVRVYINYSRTPWEIDGRTIGVLEFEVIV